MEWHLAWGTNCDREAKSREDMYYGTSGFLGWNSDTSHLVPLTSLAGLHSSSLTLLPFQHTRYSSLFLKTWLSKMCSTSYSLTPSLITGGGGSCCTCLAMVSVLYGISSVTE